MSHESSMTVQQWVDTLPTGPAEPEGPSEAEERPREPPVASAAPVPSPGRRRSRMCMLRDSSQQSLQSDDGSGYCSSVESLLEQRRPDPEQVLIGLGFGPPHSATVVSRIPERFLQPSKLLPHIDLNKFLAAHGLIRGPDHSSPSSPARFKPKPN